MALSSERSPTGRLYAPGTPTGYRLWWHRHRLTVIPYLYIAPFFILFAIFLAWPVVSSFYLSFHKQQGISTPTFIGLDNYINLLADPRFKQSLLNTTVYALGSLLLQIPLAFILAAVVNSKLVPWASAKSFYRLSYFVPLLTSAVIASLMFSILYDYNSGLINSYLVRLFGEEAKVGWVRNSSVVKFSIILLLIWRFTGINSLYFVAGLQNIPKELEEAASIDGANWWQVLIGITIPLMRPVILFVTVTAINGSYQIFAEPYPDRRRPQRPVPKYRSVSVQYRLLLLQSGLRILHRIYAGHDYRNLGHSQLALLWRLPRGSIGSPLGAGPT